MNQQMPHHTPHGAYPIPPAEGIELSALLAGLRRSKWIILLCIALSGLAAIVTLNTVRPSYFSYVEVLLNTRQERVVGVEQVVSDLNVTNSVVAGEIAVLRSNVLLGRVVDDLGLMTHPDFDPTQISGPSLFSRLAFWRSAEEPMPETEGTSETGLSEQDARNIVIWKVRRDLSAYQSGISYVINISMRAHDPEVASGIANAVAERYIQDQLGAKLVATQRAIAWLDNRLIELETQLRVAEDAVVEFLAEQVIKEGGDAQSVSLQLGEMNRAIVAARNDRAAADAALTHVRSLLAANGPEGAAVALDTVRLTRLDDELATLERDRAQLATRLGPRHPQMLALQLALEDLRRDRLDAIRAGISELEAAVAQARGRERAIAEEIQAAQLVQVELSRSSVRLSQLERSASAMRQVYESFLARFQETTQQLEFQRADARIITEAQPALAPARPRKNLILAVALVLGAILGIAAALVREIMSPALRTPQHLAATVALPVIGVLPEVRTRGWPWLRAAVWQRKHLTRQRLSRYAQALWLLQRRLLDNGKARPKSVLFTSSESGAGTSSAALGLARVITRTGKRVAIVDANPRKPALAKMLGTTASEAEGSEVEPGLFLYHLEAGGDLAALLKDLKKIYDDVVIDAPPITEAPDSLSLASLVEAVVLVARSHKSRAYLITVAADMLDKSGARVAGTVLSHSARHATVPLGSSQASRFTREHEMPVNG